MVDIGSCSIDSIEEMYTKITAERDNHIPRLAATAHMWRDARAWLKDHAELLIATTYSPTCPSISVTPMGC